MTTIRHFTKEKIMLNEYETINYCGSIGDFIVEQYYGKTIPYSVFDVSNGSPCLENEITFDIDRLCQNGGEYVVMETPSAGLDAAAWVFIISAVISVAYAATIKIPKMLNNVQRDDKSANNIAGARSNQARPLQRIPDIRGTVKSIPDIIMPPYSRYISLRDKVEYGYYCVGRKTYDIPLATINDGDTPIQKIDGATVEIYGPNKSPMNSAPDSMIGEEIDLPLYSPYRSNEVDGIQLPAPQETGDVPIVHAKYILTDWGDIRLDVYNTSPPTHFEIGFSIKTTKLRYLDGNPDYYAGNILILKDFIYNTVGDVDYTDISGEYKITDVTWTGHAADTDLYVIEVEANGVTFTPGGKEVVIGASMTTKFATPYNEWYYMTRDNFTTGFVNIVAPNGLYRDTGTGVFQSLENEFDVEIEPLDSNNDPSGTSQIISSSLAGNSEVLRGITIDFTLPYATKFRARVKRTTARRALSGVVVDEIKLEDLYGLTDVTVSDFGNVTTMYTKTFLNKFATTQKERQLNCIATEMLYEYLCGGVFDTNLTVNNRGVQSFITDAIDPKIGGLTMDDIAADELLNMEIVINNYFGEAGHNEFNYTFDGVEMTFQEHTQTIFNTMNCVAYREGSVITAHFEKATTTPSMLFTHRSKLPGSETYSRNFNPSTVHDGVEFVWIDPATNTNEVIYIPADKSALNPKKIEMAGFRNFNQAEKRAYREYYKLTNEKISVQFSTTAEGRYVKPGDVVSIVKGSRTQTYDGEVLGVAMDGVTLTLSQDVAFVPMDDHFIILKKDDGSTESLMCIAGATTNEVVLQSLPSFSIRDGIDYQRRTEFSFGNEARHLGQLFIIRTIDITDDKTINLSGVNYTDNYYAYDDSVVYAFSDGFDDGFS